MITAYIVGIYCRLSREDRKNGKVDVSLSIENQKAMLIAYAEQQGWVIYKVYIDDDVSGTTFDRDGFKEMLGDIESGKINCVITKDLSRFGRNRIESARYREDFLERGIRFIAVNDGYDNQDEVDPNNGYDVATPIKELVNEMYAAEVSRKVRATKKLMANQGKFANSRAPYGYLKSPEDKHKLVIDENVAQNVVRIFDLYISGMTGRAIAELFNQEGILPPNEYFYRGIGKPNPYKNTKNSWGSGTIMGMVKNPVYYGAMSNCKRVKTSFKSKRIVNNSADSWVIIPDTHEPIVSKETWDEAQRINSSNQKENVRRNVQGEVSLFAGIVKCADCGGNMAFGNKKFKSYTQEFYRCGTYVQKGKEVCTTHKIDYHVLYQAVLEDIQRYAVLAVEDEQALIDKILKANDDFKVKSLSRYERNIREAKNRIKIIDGLLQSLFEEKVGGNVSAETFRRMAAKYEDEQRQLQDEVIQLENELEESKRVEQDLTGWIKRIKECLTIDSITRAIAVELIDRIEVGETYDEAGEKNLDLEIFYKFGLKNSAKENRAC